MLFQEKYTRASLSSDRDGPEARVGCGGTPPCTQKSCLFTTPVPVLPYQVSTRQIIRRDLIFAFRDGRQCQPRESREHARGTYTHGETGCSVATGRLPLLPHTTRGPSSKRQRPSCMSVSPRRARMPSLQPSWSCRLRPSPRSPPPRNRHRRPCHRPRRLPTPPSTIAYFCCCWVAGRVRYGCGLCPAQPAEEEENGFEDKIER